MFGKMAEEAMSLMKVLIMEIRALTAELRAARMARDSDG